MLYYMHKHRRLLHSFLILIVLLVTAIPAYFGRYSLISQVINSIQSSKTAKQHSTTNIKEDNKKRCKWPPPKPMFPANSQKWTRNKGALSNNHFYEGYSCPPPPSEPDPMESEFVTVKHLICSYKDIRRIPAERYDNRFGKVLISH